MKRKEKKIHRKTNTLLFVSVEICQELLTAVLGLTWFLLRVQFSLNKLIHAITFHDTSSNFSFHPVPCVEKLPEKRNSNVTQQEHLPKWSAIFQWHPLSFTYEAIICCNQNPYGRPMMSKTHFKGRITRI
uniref:Uncharacterized protein n=1 Tax=Glossina brevipalpis TaxID=37001 RepID=A0A1A9W9Y3_9MUSC